MSLRSLFLPILVAAPGLVFAQANLIDNSGMDQPIMTQNLWGGVDSAGNLTGFKNLQRGVWGQGNSGVPLLQEDGSVSDRPDNLPVSVNLVDLNGDGLPDLVMADVAGYYRVYFNSGTKTEPKFTNCEMVPLFLSRDLSGWCISPEYIRFAPRLNLYDWNHRGLQDLTVGNYKGEVFFVPNTGSKSVPEFRQPVPLESALIKTNKKGDLWANLIAPQAYDWDGDGKTDLLVGEGSYSANAIHLLINKGSNQAPKFDEDGRYYLAYGDGREQLVPTIVDYNGDGKPDLLVADRTGKVAVYLNTGEKWKPDTVLKFSNFVKFGGSESLGGPITVCAADYNGDGLFDLIIGDRDGHVRVALNKGTKEQPQFDTPFLVKGVNPGQPNIYLPPPGPQAVGPNNHKSSYASGWSFDSGFRKANINGYFTVVSGKDDPSPGMPEGHHFIKAGYFPSLNKVFPPAAVFQPGWLEKNYPGERNSGLFVYWNWYWPLDASAVGFVSQTNSFHARYILKENALKLDTEYILSFKVKGADYHDAKWTMAYYGYTKHDEKVTAGARGSKQVDITNLKTDMNIESSSVPSTAPDWTTVTRNFRVHFKDHDVNKPDKLDVIMALFDIHFTLKPYSGVFYIDDLQLKEVPK